MKILKQNSTHKAVLNGNKIDIIIKGITDSDYVCKDEKLYSIPKENKDDLFAIFENLDEENRINVAQASEEFKAIMNSI